MLKRPILKFEIEEAQKHARSANQAARYLGVNIRTYQKYAKLYGLYERVLNQIGVGISKGYSKSQAHSTKLKDIFDNKHPNYPLQRLKWRMVNRGLIEDKCMLCGFEEERITDKKKPLILIFKDKKGDYSLSNLILLCYNCCFLTNDAPWVVNKRNVESSVLGKIKEPTSQHLNPYVGNSSEVEPENDLTDEEILLLKEEIDRELGRV